MGSITQIIGREILDSRGNPTVEVEVLLKSGAMGRAAVPSGASTGSREALELRDTKDKRFDGKGVLQSVHNINEIICPNLLGLESSHQVYIDQTLRHLDNTKNKKNLGANSILGVSIAVAKATAIELELPLYTYLGGINAKVLPVPMMNIINGGAHADNNVDIQEFMILPVGAESFAHALQMGTEIFHSLKRVLAKNGYSTSVGDEGGFAPNLRTNEEAMECILEGIVKAGYTPGSDTYIGIDAAASEFYLAKEECYKFNTEQKSQISAYELITMYSDWVEKYPLISIEDGLDESDWKGWQHLTEELGDKIQVVGDDIFVTNTEILADGISKNIANSILIKLNQIGTITETIDAVDMAHRGGYTAIISHRSGETEDTTIADLAVALNTGQIKAGAPSRTDRVAKYNQLLRIEEKLGTASIFSGRQSFRFLSK